MFFAHWIKRLFCWTSVFAVDPSILRFDFLYLTILSNSLTMKMIYFEVRYLKEYHRVSRQTKHTATLGHAHLAANNRLQHIYILIPLYRAYTLTLTTFKFEWISLHSVICARTAKKCGALASASYSCRGIVPIQFPLCCWMELFSDSGYRIVVRIWMQLLHRNGWSSFKIAYCKDIHYFD